MVLRSPGTIGMCFPDVLYQSLECRHSIDSTPQTISHFPAGRDIQTFVPLTIGSLETKQNDIPNPGMLGTVTIVLALIPL